MFRIFRRRSGSRDSAIASDRAKPARPAFAPATKRDTEDALLALFGTPRALDLETWRELWSEHLGRPYRKVIAEFQSKGYLRPATVLEKAQRLTVADLKDILRSHGLKLGGRKDDLIQRVHDSAFPGLEVQLAESDLFVLTESGRARVAPYEAQISAAREAAESTASVSLWQGDVDAAIQAVVAFHRVLPQPMARGGPASRDQLLELLAMPIPKDVDPQVFAGYRVQAANCWLWGRRVTGPAELLPYAYTAAFRASSRRQLADLKASGIKKVRVLASGDSCEHCRNLAALGPYSIGKAPELPSPKCTREWCRCCYVAHFD